MSELALPISEDRVAYLRNGVGKIGYLFGKKIKLDCDLLPLTKKSIPDRLRTSL